MFFVIWVNAKLLVTFHVEILFRFSVLFRYKKSLSSSIDVIFFSSQRFMFNKLKFLNMKSLVCFLIISICSSLVFAQNQDDDDDDDDDNEVDSEYITRAEIPFAGNVEILWKLNTFVKVVDHAIIDNDKIYVTIADENRDFGQVWAMDKKSGKILWKSEKQEGIPLHGAKQDGNNIVFSTRRAIVSLNKSNGKTNWVAYNPYSKMIGSDCAIFMDVIVASTSDYDIFGVSKKDGKIIWKKEIKEISGKRIQN